MYCRSLQDAAAIEAYKVTYSYRGPALASDESGNTRYSFSMYLRPEELVPGLRDRIVAKKISRAALAKYCDVKTYRDSVQMVVIDKQNSALCAGTYVDGQYARTDRKCLDKVAYSSVPGASSYLGIRLEPKAGGPGQIASEAKAPAHN